MDFCWLVLKYCILNKQCNHLVICISKDSSLKNENSVIIYSPSFHYKPDFLVILNCIYFFKHLHLIILALTFQAQSHEPPLVLSQTSEKTVIAFQILKILKLCSKKLYKNSLFEITDYLQKKSRAP